MRLFLDASVLLAAAGSANGSSRALFTYADTQSWVLVSSPHALNEVLRNLSKLPGDATTAWLRLRPQIAVVDDVVPGSSGHLRSWQGSANSVHRAGAEVLLTLDKSDFAGMLGGTFYGLSVLLPHDFLERERAASRLTPTAQ